MRILRVYSVFVLFVSAISCSAGLAQISDVNARLRGAYRFQQGGWTYVHLEGSPAAIGFQHGYLLAP